MTAPNRDLQILEKICRYCDDIVFTHNEYNRDYDVFCTNPTYKNAVALCILQIGELVKNLSEEFTLANPSIPWKSIRGMRNVVAHQCGHIDIDTLWNTSEEKLIELRDFCISQLAPEEDQGMSLDLSM